MHTTGYSAGAVFSAYLMGHRSDSLASFSAWSTGEADPANRRIVPDPPRPVPGLLYHGGRTDTPDWAGRKGTLSLAAHMTANGALAVVCDHGLGHVVPGPLDATLGQMWSFMLAHPFGRERRGPREASPAGCPTGARSRSSYDERPRVGGLPRGRGLDEHVLEGARDRLAPRVQLARAGHLAQHEVAVADLHVVLSGAGGHRHPHEHVAGQGDEEDRRVEVAPERGQGDGLAVAVAVAAHQHLGGHEEAQDLPAPQAVGRHLVGDLLQEGEEEAEAPAVAVGAGGAGEGPEAVGQGTGRSSGEGHVIGGEAAALHRMPRCA